MLDVSAPARQDEGITRQDIHEAAKNDHPDGVKPGGHDVVSEATQVEITGADAVPESTTGVNDPGTPNQSE